MPDDPAADIAAGPAGAEAAGEVPEDLLDAQTLAELRQGNQAAWEAFIAAYERRIYAFLYRLEGREDALDLTQEVFMRAWRSIATFRAGERALPWLFQIARNTQIERHRRKQLGQFSLDEAHQDLGFEISSPAATPARHAESLDSQDRVQRALEGLAPEYREAVVLRFMEDLPYDEIARVQGVALGTAKSRVFRAKEQLAALLQDVADLN